MSTSTKKSVIKKMNNRRQRPANNNNHDIPSQKIKFQSSDSQGSDISYQSSIESDDDIQLGRVQYFKEEMARFFINYPQLINEDIIEKDKDEVQFNLQQQNTETKNNNYRKGYTTHKNYWAPIAHDIIKQAKQPTTSLQSIAKRITLYRNKVDQQDLIDMLLKQQSGILKEIEDQIKQRKYQNTDGRLNFNHDRITKQSQSVHGGQTIFYSWKKRRQMELKKINNSLSKQQQIKRSNSTHKNTNTTSQIKSKYNNKSLHKEDNTKKGLKINSSTNFNQKGQQIHVKDVNNNNNNNNFSGNQKIKSKTIYQQNQNNSLNKLQSTQFIPNPPVNKYILNFQPKTEAGKQLYDQIKRFNPNDDLNIKKTIINFLIKHRQNMQKQIISKSTLSQKINKLYSEDSKQLVMFYPASKSQMNDLRDRDKNSGLGYSNGMSSGGTYHDFHPSIQTQNIMNILKQISQGPLMKYWKQLQQKKL